MVICALAVTGCVSMPSSGPVGSYSVTQGSADSNQEYLQVNVQSPGNNWSPVEIAQGFLAANASFANEHGIAREYLTGPQASTWNAQSATVFKSTPTVSLLEQTERTAEVTVSGTQVASVGQSGAYTVAQAEHGSKPITITLVRVGGQWRISGPPQVLLLSETDFAADYQSRDLYYFNPSKTWLVADPIYVPIEAARAVPDDLLQQLVTDLVQQPAGWLGNGATLTSFPSQTKVLSVTLAGGTVTVNLGGAIGNASQTDLQQVAAQLLWTLGVSNDQPAVGGVQLEINGKPWTPGNSGVSVLQQGSFTSYAPPQGSGTGTFYYLDSHGDVLRQPGPNGTPSRVYTNNGVKFTFIAVSPDQRYLAAFADGWVYTGPIGGKLVKRVQGDFTSLSWDSSDELWLASPAGVEVMQKPSAPAIPVFVESQTGTVTALRVAPDGVRVALVINGITLTFGAISVSPAGVAIYQSPFSVNSPTITALTWYGSDDVIALSGTGAASAATEYPVNGGASTGIQSVAGMANITASWGNPLISNPANGDMSYNESTSGSWISLGVTGISATYPG
jgi:spore germination protein GerM